MESVDGWLVCSSWLADSLAHLLWDTARGRSRRSIDFYDILWAEVTEDGKHLRIDFAEHTQEHYLEARNLTFSLPLLPTGEADNVLVASLASWVELLLDRSYGNAARRK